MKYCNACGEIVKGVEEFHPKCLNKLFGTPFVPKIDLSLQEISLKAQEMAGKLSISGVQPKLSLKYNKKSKRLEVSQGSGEYILKPQVETFHNIPQNENLCMIIAEKLGISVPPHALIRLKDKSLAYIVKRFDRVKGEKLHQEDFSQVLGEKDKYRGSMEKVANRLRMLSDFPGLDLQLLFERMLFFFIIGNGDAHLKNFSFLYHLDGSIRLSPAYDIVSSKLVIPDEEDMALSMNGKRNKITRQDFNQFADKMNIRTIASFNRILKEADFFFILIANSYLDKREKKKLYEIIKERIDRF